MLSYKMLKHLTFFFTLFFYYLRSDKTDIIYSYLVKITYFLIPGILIYYFTDILDFIIFDRLWVKPIIPLIYVIGFLALYNIFKKNTREIAYSFTISMLMILSVGWLYEIPRYIKLQGFYGIFRFSKNFFYLDASIISFILVYYLTFHTNFKKNWISVSGFLAYFIYFFYAFNFWNQHLGSLDIPIYRAIPILCYILISSQAGTSLPILNCEHCLSVLKVKNSWLICEYCDLNYGRIN